MSITKERKAELIEKYKRHEGDTGSVEVQVSIITHRINHLNEHLKTHKHDYSSQRGLMKLIGQRRSFLNYLKSNEFHRYQDLIAALGLRK